MSRGPVEAVTEGFVLVNEVGKFLRFDQVSTHLGYRIEVRTTDELHQATVNPSYMELRTAAGRPMKRLPVRVTRKVELVTEQLDFTLGDQP